MPAKVHVGNISSNTTDETLRVAFGHFGRILDVEIVRDRDTGQSKEFGFVIYGTQQEAEYAMSMHEQELDGDCLKLR